MKKFRFIFRFHVAAEARTPQEARMEILEALVAAGIGDMQTPLDLVRLEPLAPPKGDARAGGNGSRTVVLSPEFDED